MFDALEKLENENPLNPTHTLINWKGKKLLLGLDLFLILDLLNKPECFSERLVLVLLLVLVLVLVYVDGGVWLWLLNFLMAWVWKKKRSNSTIRIRYIVIV